MKRYILQHSGTLHRSGRYKDGSGDDPYQHCHLWLRRKNQLLAQGKTEKEIAAILLGPEKDSRDLRAKTSYYKMQEESAGRSRAKNLYEKYSGNVKKVAEEMDISEGTVRKYLKEKIESDRVTFEKTCEILKKECNNPDKPYGVDVGKSVHYQIGCSNQTLRNALRAMEDEGYRIFKITVEQPTNPGKWTTRLTMAKTDPTKDYLEQRKDIYHHRDQIAEVGEWIVDRSDDDPEANVKKFVMGIKPPVSIDPDRVYVRKPSEGGKLKDGIIELRRGVKDLDMGDSLYAQVRIKVGDKHYIKGMAVYSDDLPPGKDIVFNSSKPDDYPIYGTDKDRSVFKLLKKDPLNPFGSYIKKGDANHPGGQREYLGDDGKYHLSALNIVREQGEWDNWSKTLSSQFMSKQDPKLAKEQLAKSYDERVQEFNEIKTLTNPVLRQNLLNDLAGKCDTDSYELKCKGFPNTNAHVILPLTSIKNNECYAPNYPDGTRLVLVRYPHGGRFELPEVVVNNRNKEGRKTIGLNSLDAIGISARTAEQLAGADFDGDTVWAIPNNNGKIKTEKAIKDLVDFNNKEAYPKVEGMKVMTSRGTQIEMGKITNLITDMTQDPNCTTEEIVRAIKHSQVVVDAEKHGLNYKQSEADFRIKELKIKYQGSANAGARTFISRVHASKKVPDFVERGVDKKTGEKIIVQTGKTYTPAIRDKDGNIIGLGEPKLSMKAVPNVTKVRMIGGTASDLSSGSEIDTVYVNHSDRMLGLANEIRKVAANEPTMKRDPNAAKIYATEVASLDEKLRKVGMNRVHERSAVTAANYAIKAMEYENPELRLAEKKDERTKLHNMAMQEARYAFSSNKKEVLIHLTSKEYEAIQSGAVSTTKMKEIFNNCDKEELIKIASPKKTKASTLSSSQISKIKAMKSSGRYTIREIAEALGVSTSTVSEVTQ